MKRLAPLLLAASCTSTQALRLPADEAQLKYVNETVRDQPAKLKLKENKTFAVFSLSLDETTARYKDAEGGEHSVALDSVGEIKYLAPGHPRWAGSRDGGLIGLGMGVVAGSIIGFSLGDDSCQGFCIKFSAADKALFLGAAAGLLGMIAGGVAGALYGHHDSLVPAPREPGEPAADNSP